MSNRGQKNIDAKTVKGFGEEWKHFNQDDLKFDDLQALFKAYFRIFPLESLNKEKIGADVGCGSGRWAKLIAPKVGKLYCIDASAEALSVAQKNLSHQPEVTFIHASLENMPLDDESLDFIYSLGVLHHIPDTMAGIEACVKKLKPGGLFLVYLYYAFDNKPAWFRVIWKISDYLRRVISRLPFAIKLPITQIIAVCVYFPLTRLALLLEKLKCDVSNIPLSGYRDKSFYVMRTDALDRFGTRLEKRFTREQIIRMFEQAGLVNIQTNNEVPYWCVIGYKRE